ncbi:MAG: AbgT family transporter [Melioribacteraceae bacterium]|nr:AbgT family transporter [Melioribacteraceae bacterium]MCF8263317.1 AbgT family transporter [Melioribacteraceae bacterium]MCF8413897.1 AbgT family transporter [Melioribacteraceae bacterium]
MKLTKLKAPNTFLIMFIILVIVAAMTWVIPAGEFERTEKNGREVVENGTFHEVEKNPQNIDDLLTAPVRGFADPDGALIIGLVLIVGGAFTVFQKTEAVDSAIKSIAKAHSKSSLLQKMLIPILMIIFSLAGAVFGMSEEVIPFILIMIPLALTLGYDTVTGVAIPFIGAGAGFAGAFINPFTIGIAQGIADIPLFSGMEYRILVWIIVTSIAIIFVMRYARRVKANPKLSFMYEKDQEKKKDLHLKQFEEFEGIDRTHKIVLGIFLAGLLLLVVGVLNFGWYIEEISGLFLALGIIVGFAGKLSIKEITDAFVKGAKDLIPTGLIIASARAILIVAEDGRIIDTILNYLSSLVEGVHPIISAQLMFFVQSFLNFFVPSGSGQAALTMPIMAPLSDLVEVSRQTAVLAFQFGDGFSNLIIPTSAVTMGILALADIPWEKWAKWIFPLILLFTVASMLLLIPPFIFGWN